MTADAAARAIDQGIVAQKSGDVTAAEKAFRAALVIDLENTAAYQRLVELLMAAGRVTEARDVLQSALARMPDSAALHSAMGRALVRLNAPDAVSHLAAAVKLQPDVRTHASNLFTGFSHFDLDFPAVDPQFLEQTYRRHNSLAFKRHLSGAPVKFSGVTRLDAWARERGAATFVVDADEDVVLRYGEPAREDRYRAAATRVVRVDGAAVIVGWDHVFAPDGCVLDGSGYMSAEKSFGWFPHVYFRSAAKMLHPWCDSCIQIDAPALFMSTPQEYQIGHWIVDFLPRLCALGAEGLSGLKIAVPETLPNRHREMMSHFGVRDTDTLNLKLTQRYQFKSLYVVEQGHRNDPHPAKVRFLHDKFARGVAAAGTHRIFLQRSQTNRGRMIANQEEFGRLLAAFKFETVNLADLTVAAQADALKRAGIVIGSMGSDLSSMFFLGRGAHLVALIQDDTAKTGVDNDVRAFERYGAILDIPVHRFTCKSVGDPQRVGSGNRADYYKNIEIDCERLGRLLAAIAA